MISEVCDARIGRFRAPLMFVAKIGGLVGGFAIGQGSVFVVQTWLLTQGKLAVIASFGYALAILSLAQWIADWGGLILLSRHAILGRDFGAVWAANLARLIIALPITLVLATLIILYGSDAFAAGILWGGLLVAPLWAFNLSGFLDGHGKSATSGPTAALPWIGSAIATYILFRAAADGPLMAYGLVVGIAYTAGCAACVLLQYGIARSVCSIRFSRVTRKDTLAFLREGAAYCLGEFPNQLYGRLLIVIVSASLGQQVMGLYVYIRQILIGIAQVIGFIKRVEFPKLAMALATHDWRRMMKSQSVNLGFSAVVFVGAVVAFFLRATLPARFDEVAYYFLFFAPVLPIWALSMSFGQAVILHGRMNFYSMVLIATIATSALFTYHFTRTFGLTFIAACEVTMYTIQLSIFAGAMRRM